MYLNEIINHVTDYLENGAFSPDEWDVEGAARYIMDTYGDLGSMEDLDVDDLTDVLQMFER